VRAAVLVNTLRAGCRRRALCVTVVILSVGATCAQQGAYPDPARFEEQIAAFDASDSLSPPPEGAIVAVGSSSMRGWHRRIHQDLAPLTIVPRGFGGSTMGDVLHFAKRIVSKHKPRAVLLYEGDNDVAAGVEPADIRATFDSLTTVVKRIWPRPRLYVISVKPSPRRWHLWPRMQATNELLRAACDEAGWMTFTDVAGPMLNEDGVPRPEIFKSDSLHLNDVGYDIWADVIGPLLREREAVFEETSLWSGSDQDGVFEGGIAPGEYGGDFETPPQPVPLYHAASARSRVLRTATFGPGQLTYDEVRYRTVVPGLYVATADTQLSGVNYGSIAHLARTEYYGFGARWERFPIAAGDTLVYLQYRAEGNHFVRRGTDVLGVKMGHGVIATLEHVRPPRLELWLHLVDDQGEALGWYRVPDRRVARHEPLR
jgi:lysophospholipase L1-like esterase